jgi:hypothetical protein
MDSRDIFLVAALLSAGAFIRFILVLSGQPVTPNVMVAFYSIAIMVILPSFGEAIGIGLVSGGITALISRFYCQNHWVRQSASRHSRSFAIIRG